MKQSPTRKEIEARIYLSQVCNQYDLSTQEKRTVVYNLCCGNNEIAILTAQELAKRCDACSTIISVDICPGLTPQIISYENRTLVFAQFDASDIHNFDSLLKKYGRTKHVILRHPEFADLNSSKAMIGILQHTIPTLLKDGGTAYISCYQFFELTQVTQKLIDINQLLAVEAATLNAMTLSLPSSVSKIRHSLAVEMTHGPTHLSSANNQLIPDSHMLSVSLAALTNCQVAAVSQLQAALFFKPYQTPQGQAIIVDYDEKKYNAARDLAQYDRTLLLPANYPTCLRELQKLLPTQGIKVSAYTAEFEMGNINVNVMVEFTAGNNTSLNAFKLDSIILRAATDQQSGVMMFVGINIEKNATLIREAHIKAFPTPRQTKPGTTALAQINASENQNSSTRGDPDSKAAATSSSHAPTQLFHPVPSQDKDIEATSIKPPKDIVRANAPIEPIRLFNPAELLTPQNFAIFAAIIAVIIATLATVLISQSEHIDAEPMPSPRALIGPRY